jgi:hypothetical protein
MLEVANTVLRLIPKYSIALHGNTWNCSIAEDASGKDLCFHVATVLYKSTTSGQARCTTEGEQPIIHNRAAQIPAVANETSEIGRETNQGVERRKRECKDHRGSGHWA